MAHDLPMVLVSADKSVDDIGVQVLPLALLGSLVIPFLPFHCSGKLDSHFVQHPFALPPGL